MDRLVPLRPGRGYRRCNGRSALRERRQQGRRGSWLATPLFVLVVGAVLALPACSQRSGASAATGPIGCAAPSPVDAAVGAPVAGPLVFYGYGGQTTHAIVGDFEPGVPTKVGIGVIHTLAAPVTLEGWECATGERLRFW